LGCLLLTDFSAYSRKRLKIGKPPRNTREDVYISQELEREQERQITEHDCPRTCMKETVTEDENKVGWANSFIKLSRHEIKFGIDSILDIVND
jgi:hypothetical protein